MLIAGRGQRDHRLDLGDRCRNITRDEVSSKPPRWRVETSSTGMVPLQGQHHPDVVIQPVVPVLGLASSRGTGVLAVDISAMRRFCEPATRNQRNLDSAKCAMKAD